MVLLSEQLLIAPLALLIGHHCGSRRGPAYRTGHGPSFVCVPGFFSRGHGPRSGCHPLTSIPQAPACTATQLHPPPHPFRAPCVLTTQPYLTNRCSGEMCFIKPFSMQTEGNSPQPPPLTGVQTTPLQPRKSVSIAAKYNQGDPK